MGLWKKKDIHELLANSGNDRNPLLRTLSATQLIMLGIGAIVGAGLFSITGVAAAEHAGPAIILSFLIAALGCVFVGLCYSELAAMVPVAGSAYTYTYTTMGQLVAWIVGWNLILEYAIGASTVAISWSAYLVSLLHDLGFNLPSQYIASPWQPVQLPDGSLNYGLINLPAIFIVVALSFLLMLGIRQSTRINSIIVVIKVSVIVLFIGVGVWYIKAENFIPFIPENTGEWGAFGWSGILKASGILFFAYIGFDAVSTAAQEAKNPQKTMPIGIIVSLIICTILFILFSFVLIGLAPYTELNVASPVAVALSYTPFPWFSLLVKIAILAGFTSVILVLLLGQSRIFFSMAKDRLLPHSFSDIHPKYQTPAYSHAILMIFVSLFSAFAPISLVGELTSIGTLLAFILVCVSVLILRKTHPEFKRPFKTPWSPIVPALGIILCSIMMVSLGLDTWLRLLAWSAIGMVIYFAYGRQNSKKSKPSQ
jgi:APA family basic amino acid/polyamine antiporter